MKKLKENWKNFIPSVIIYLLIIVTLFLIDAALVSLTEISTSITSSCFNILYIFVICGLYYLLPKKLFAPLYGIFTLFFAFISFSQIMYFKIFGSLYGISSILHFSDGISYISSVKAYITPAFITIFLSIILLVILNIVFILKFEKLKFKHSNNYIIIILIILVCMLTRALTVLSLGKAEETLSWWSFDNKRNTYIEFNNPNASFKITGIYEYVFRSVYLHFKNLAIPDSPQLNDEVSQYFDNNTLTNEQNEYSNVFENKNVIIIMCESIDDWQVTEQVMPTLYNLRKTGLNFSNYYAPFFGTGATINSELASLTGLFQSSNASDYIDSSENIYPLSLPNLFKEKGYSVNSVHFNKEIFYNRSVFHKNLGFENHYSLLDDSNVTCDSDLDSNLAKDDYIYNLIVPKQEEKFMTFITTFTPHLPYDTTNEVFNKILLDEDTLESLTVSDDEETTVINVLSNETDNFIKVLLQRLEKDNLLDDTVLVIFSDHYNYYYSDEDKICEMKNTTKELIYKVPFVIWSKDIAHKDVSLLVQTIDILPTLANMFGLDYIAKNYLRADVFSSYHKNLVYFNNYSWYDGNIHSKDITNISKIYNNNFEYVTKIININNLIMKLNYYSK